MRMCADSPVKLESAVTTVELFKRPLTMETVLLRRTAPTLCPPVTFAYAELVKSDGTNAVWLVMAVDGIMPLSTWYCRRASTAAELLAKAAELLRRAEIAALFGARTVMLVAEDNVASNSGLL